MVERVQATESGGGFPESRRIVGPGLPLGIDRKRIDSVRFLASARMIGEGRRWIGVVQVFGRSAWGMEVAFGVESGA